MRRHLAIRSAYGQLAQFSRTVAKVAGAFCLFVFFGFFFVSWFQGKGGPVVDASETKSPLEETIVQEEIKSEDLASEEIINTSGFPYRYAFLADKDRKKLYIYERAGTSWKKIKEFPIILGENPGQKQFEGDKRTPEGLYWIIGERTSLELDTVVYGNRAFVLNYPNFHDVRGGRTGSGIWIHGTDRSVSRGCIGLDKNLIPKLAPFALIGTPVLITNNDGDKNFGKLVDEKTLFAERDSAFNSSVYQIENIYTFVRSWSDAWERADIRSYRSFYSPDRFFSRDMNFHQWMAYKESIFNRIREHVTVRVHEFSIETLGQEMAAVTFQQYYRAMGQEQNSRKKLLLTRKDGTWKITGEGVVTN
jgi:murein L,D-transpeptidase YafK